MYLRYPCMFLLYMYMYTHMLHVNLHVVRTCTQLEWKRIFFRENTSKETNSSGKNWLENTYDEQLLFTAVRGSQYKRPVHVGRDDPDPFDQGYELLSVRQAYATASSVLLIRQVQPNHGGFYECSVLGDRLRVRQQLLYLQVRRVLFFVLLLGKY